MNVILILLVIAVLLCAAPCVAEPLTYVDLVKKLTDLEGLAILPAQGETCKQWSSYDRASRYDEATGKYVGWDANGDGNGIIRMEGDRQVWAEMKGPGCIWRIWSALAKEGHVKIYLDGASEPAVDLPFDGYFNLKNKPFDYPGLVHTVASGRNCYVPIPYQKSCKITAEGDWGAYYQFNYTTYPEGTIVPTFTRDLGPDEMAALDRAGRFLTKSLGTGPGSYDKQVALTPVVDVAPGKTVTVARIAGPEAITCLRANIGSEKYTEEQLRKTILKVYWDGEKEPSVWCPIGDFFGAGLGMKEYKSLPLGITERDAYSYWYMPFAREARIELTNTGSAPFATQFYISYAPLKQPIEKLGRFHARWHRDAFLPPEPERWIDWTIVKTEGKGRFCGVALEVWNPTGGWWGEGDEKFHVDGEKFPSTIGTGSEDYFGYAWCNPALFYNAYHNQPRNDNNNNASHVSVNRWQIAENIPFQTSFDGYIEKYYANKRPTLYAATAYWYLSADGKDPYKAVASKDLWGWYKQPVVVKVPGRTEGESLPATMTGGNATPQMLSEHWSGNSHVWWREAKPGDKLTLTFRVPKAGKHELILAFTKASDYGIIQLSLDGKPLGKPIDFFHSDGVIHSGPVSFGTFALAKGEHKLTAEVVGANEKAIKGYMFGLDYVQLKGAK